MRHDLDDTNNTYTPSPKIQNQIDKLIAEEKAQRKRTWSYYEKIRKDDPARYRDPKTHSQMFQDAIALGDAFADGDFEIRNF